ncbi:MAG: hypothetical protein PHW92_09055 [Lutibacter sp.]|nr:hypothetical protein [Lutibacter sp.]
MNGISFYISSVKNLFRIIGITVLTALFCTTISLAGSIFQNSSCSVKSTVEKAKDDLSVSIKLLNNTSQAESLGGTYSIAPPINYKDSNNEFSSIAKIRELFFANEFAQYIIIARNFLIKYRKANIIFPFHYFW